MIKKIPILIIAWIRTEKVKIVFEQLRSFGCENLFLSLDGPRPINYENDFNCINEVEQLALETFGKKIKIKKHNINMGCKLGVKYAIDWFFENVESGIILEDDIVPEIEFLEFCNFYLEEYKNDKRIFSISGLNGYKNWLNYSPMKSNELSKRWFVWGWATWKDRWAENYSEKINIGFELISKIFEFYQWDVGFSLDFILSILKVNLNYIDTWDYQVQAICIKNNFLNIIPRCRYIRNIGFDDSATHTNSSLDYFENINKTFLKKELFLERNLPIERKSHAIISLRSNYKSNTKGLVSNLKTLFIISFLIIKSLFYKKK